MTERRQAPAREATLRDRFYMTVQFGTAAQPVGTHVLVDGDQTGSTVSLWKTDGSDLGTQEVKTSTQLLGEQIPRGAPTALGDSLFSLEAVTQAAAATLEVRWDDRGDRHRQGFRSTPNNS